MPDYRDRFLVAVGSKYSVGQTGGEDTHRLTVDEMPSHTHTRGTMNIWGWVSGVHTCFDSMGGAFYDNGTRDGTLFTSESGEVGILDDFVFDASRNWTGATSEEGGDRAHENRPPYIAVKWMIKAK